MKDQSYWQDTAPTFKGAATETPDGRYDVAVIGAGFTGLSAARKLARSGLHVVVLEGAKVGHGASCRNGGHLNNGMAHGYADAMARFGSDGARQLYHAYDAAIDLIEEIIAEEQISCNFRRSGKLKLASKPSHVAGLRRTYELIHQEADRDTAFLDSAELKTEVGSNAFHGGMLYKKSAMMHMGQYLTGLADAAVRHGAKIYEQAAVSDRHRHDGHWYLKTAKGPVIAKNILVATGAYSGAFATSPFRYFRRRIIPVGSFIIVTEPLTDAQMQAHFPGNRTYVTSMNVGNYFRLSPDNRVIFGGRAKFSASMDPRGDVQSADILKKTLLEMFPTLGPVRIDYRFGGLVDMTQDRLPRAGKADGCYFALGYSGHGAQMSNYMGEIVADLILGNDRNPLSGMPWPAILGHFGRPWFLPVVGAYFRAKDWIS